MTNTRPYYDVVVVGSGPAGSTAARVLALGGARVCIVERGHLPRHKTCGGGVVRRAENLLPGSFHFVPDRRLHVAELNFLDSELHFSVERREPIISTVMRDCFDYALVMSAVDAGARLIVRCEALGTEDRNTQVVCGQTNATRGHEFVSPVSTIHGQTRTEQRAACATARFCSARAPRRGGFQKKRVLLVGDAAGFANPVTAEGISLAILSGQLAATAVLRGEGDPNCARATYYRLLNKHVLPELRLGCILAKIIYGCPRASGGLFQRRGQAFCEAMTEVMLGHTTFRELLCDGSNYLKLLGSPVFRQRV